jgi:hypothetical protein
MHGEAWRYVGQRLWWALGRDSQTFRLAVLPDQFLVILQFTVVLTLILSTPRKCPWPKAEYLKLLAAN